MKTTTKIATIAFATIIILLTSCHDWYEDMDSFETVLTNGKWKLIEKYQQPNPETPYNKYSKSDMYQESTGFFLYTEEGIVERYSNRHILTEEQKWNYYIEKKNKRYCI